ncbi:NAD-dependent epimerase/dehydratase family protein [Flavobacterium sp.]|uniref:NAD-dependent epimerase/dehydratase family protein n=1 Tax=Flavobacterium sp. TaxID=239 RepID=UPI002FDA3EC1
MNLVTGGTGLVGAHLLLHLLQNGEKVKALFRSEKSILKTRKFFKNCNQDALFFQIDWVQGTVNDIPSLEIAYQNIEKVYHCAALISFDASDEDALRKTNIEGTANMVNCALAFGIKKFCYVSSIAALGDLAEYETIINEDTEWNPEKPHSDYAISKYGAEMEIWRAQQEGLDCVVVNPGVILGADFWDSESAKIIKGIHKGLPFYTQGWSGFVSVKDVVMCMHLLMQSSISGERFCLISENMSFKEFIAMGAKVLKSRNPKWYAPQWLTAIGWRLDWLFCTLFFQKRTFSRALAQSLHTETQYSNTKIKAALGFEFIPISHTLEEVGNAYLTSLK